MSSLKIKTLKKILIHEEWIKINFPFKMGNIVGFMCKKKKKTNPTKRALKFSATSKRYISYIP